MVALHYHAEVWHAGQISLLENQSALRNSHRPVPALQPGLLLKAASLTPTPPFTETGWRTNIRHISFEPCHQRTSRCRPGLCESAGTSISGRGTN
jgi:hypothetical protein